MWEWLQKRCDLIVFMLIVMNVSEIKKSTNVEALIDVNDAKRTGVCSLWQGTREGGRKRQGPSGGKIKADVEITKSERMAAHISELQPSPSLLCFGGYINQNRQYKRSLAPKVYVVKVKGPIKQVQVQYDGLEKMRQRPLSVSSFHSSKICSFKSEKGIFLHLKAS